MGELMAGRPAAENNSPETEYYVADAYSEGSDYENDGDVSR
jgi:hypothetical protein